MSTPAPDSQPSATVESPAKSLFLGQIAEERLFPFPRTTGEEQETLALVIDSVDRFLEDRQDQLRRLGSGQRAAR